MYSFRWKDKIGDYIITSSSYGKIKFIENPFGKPLKVAEPSSPILVGTFETLPIAGELFKIGDKNQIESIKEELQEIELSFRKPIVIEPPEKTFEISLIIKADLVGSLEGIEKLLRKIAEEQKIGIKIIKRDLGIVTTEDLKLAKDTNSIIISFNLKNPKAIYEEVKTLNLKLIDVKVIYELEEILNELVQIKKTESPEKGKLEVLATFSKTSTKKTIGGKVILGKVSLNDRVLIIRDNSIIGKGKVISLESNKLPVKEVLEGNLCGLIINTKTDIEIGDILVFQ
jgi:translation initiation factor IF-2